MRYGWIPTTVAAPAEARSPPMMRKLDLIWEGRGLGLGRVLRPATPVRALREEECRGSAKSECGVPKLQKRRRTPTASLVRIEDLGNHLPSHIIVGLEIWIYMPGVSFTKNCGVMFPVEEKAKRSEQ